MAPRSREARAALARAWTNSSQTQEEFAREHDVSARSLGGYVREERVSLADRQVREFQEGVGQIEALRSEVVELRRQVAHVQAELDHLRAEDRPAACADLLRPPEPGPNSNPAKPAGGNTGEPPGSENVD